MARRQFSALENEINSRMNGNEYIYYNSNFSSPIPRVKLPPVWHEPRLAVLQEGGEVDAAVPVAGEVADVAVGKDGLGG